MRVMVLVKATKTSEAETDPVAGNEELFREMGRFNEELVKAGVMEAGEGLHPSSKGKRVHFSKGKPRVTDGPFAETKELVAGFWVWRVKSMDEALEWAKRCPNPMPGEEGILELRPIYEAEDFSSAEVREQETRLRAQLEAQRR